MLDLSKERIQSIIKAKGYLWFNDKINIVGVRTNNNASDKWNDYLVVSYKDEYHVFVGTTRPGVYWLKHPMRSTGAFVMKPGQYIDSWRKGMHSGYPALVQCKSIKGYRDKNLNDVVDPDINTVYTDGQYVDIHHAHAVTVQTVIDKYSAGCQVICDFENWETFYYLYMLTKQEYFSYTLLVENDWK